MRTHSHAPNISWDNELAEQVFDQRASNLQVLLEGKPGAMPWHNKFRRMWGLEPLRNDDWDSDCESDTEETEDESESEYDDPLCPIESADESF